MSIKEPHQEVTEKTEKESITLDALQKILAEQSRQNAEQLQTIIQEIKKPTVLEQQKIDQAAQELLARNEERKGNAAGITAQAADHRAVQRICSHRAPDGHTHLVFVQEKVGPGYLLCQKEQCVIRPGDEPMNYKGVAIYDTELFNNLFQTLPAAGDLIY